jgi:hypothetical protein
MEKRCEIVEKYMKVVCGVVCDFDDVMRDQETIKPKSIIFQRLSKITISRHVFRKTLKNNGLQFDLLRTCVVEISFIMEAIVDDNRILLLV